MSPAVRPFAMTSLFALVLVACGGQDAPAPTSEQRGAGSAPPPSGLQEPDPSVRRIERAAPPELQALATGRFQPRGERADAATGVLEIGDDVLTGTAGVALRTARISIVRGDDQFRPGERYSNVLMVGAAQPVELRRVVPGEDAEVEGAEAGAGDPASPADVPPGREETSVAASDEGAEASNEGEMSSAPEPRGPGICASGEPDFIALVAVSEGDRNVVRLVGLQGRSTPASGAEDIRTCDTLEYEMQRRR